jgi:arylsulfatase A-like enzyme
MRKWILALFVSLSLAAQPRAATQPKLVLAIVIDQFRYDYLTRFRGDYTGGLRRLLDQGAVFTNAHYDHVPTVTAAGHAAFLSGAPPAMSGIIGNEWWDRATAKRVTSVSDDGTKLLGGSGAGSSPRRMLQSTLGDELKMSGKGGKVIGISIKDRSAILPSGHMADGAFWFDGDSGNFVSSTYYSAELPGWVAEFNHSRPADKYAAKDWMGYKTPAAPGKALYNELEATPWGNELVEQLALRALAAEKLGANGKIDVLAVSYSSNDYVGHRVGPDAPEVRDMAIRVDQLIGELMRSAEAQAGAGNVLTVLTADHGVAPVPEVNQKRKMPGGRLDAQQLHDAIEKALNARFGQARWVAYASDWIFFNPDAIAGRRFDEAEVERVAAEALRGFPHIFRVYTRTQLLNGAILDDEVGKSVRNGFHSARSGNLMVILDPYWMISASGTTHGTPFNYDTHVPLMFLGPHVRPGRYNRNVMVNDVAPTLATILDVGTPSGSVGRVLDEALR